MLVLTRPITYVTSLLFVFHQSIQLFLLPREKRKNLLPLYISNDSNIMYSKKSADNLLIVSKTSKALRSESALSKLSINRHWGWLWPLDWPSACWTHNGVQILSYNGYLVLCWGTFLRYLYEKDKDYVHWEIVRFVVITMLSFIIPCVHKKCYQGAIRLWKLMITIKLIRILENLFFWLQVVLNCFIHRKLCILKTFVGNFIL